MMIDLVKRIKPFIDEDSLVKYTCEMIRIQSHEGIPEQETGVAKYIKGVLESFDIECELKEVEDGRCNLIAWIDSGNPGKTILLSGHMDTVKADGMENAFTPKILDGKIYGRGACDMKGPLASIIGAMIAIKKSGLLTSGKVIFAAVVDEEHKSLGTVDLLENGLTADGAIIGEATGMKICTAHRGLEWFKFHFKGKAVHGGAQKEGINAISKAVAFINEMEQSLIPEVFSKKHPLLQEATINYGVIHGGTQLSTVAGECDLYVDRRYLPYETYEGVLEEFRSLINRLEQKDPEFRCEMSILEESVMKEGYVHEPMETDFNDPFVAAVKESVEIVLDEESEMTFFPAWTDGGLLNNYGNIPTVIFGPGLVECCHALNEYIPIAHLPQAALIYTVAAISFCSSY